MIELIEHTIPDGQRGGVFGILEQTNLHHPAEPHWYLPMIGVDPRCRRAGFGSALLDHALEICDRDGMPAYLESSNSENITLYRRHGFEVVGTIKSAGSLPLYPMLRPACGFLAR